MLSPTGVRYPLDGRIGVTGWGSTAGRQAARAVNGYGRILSRDRPLSGSNSVVECQLPKLDVVGSNPISRSILSITYRWRLPSASILTGLKGKSQVAELNGPKAEGLDSTLNEL